MAGALQREHQIRASGSVLRAVQQRAVVNLQIENVLPETLKKPADITLAPLGNSHLHDLPPYFTSPTYRA